MKQFKLPNGKKIFALNKLGAQECYKEIYEDDIYFQFGIEVKPGDVVMDVGANIGLFSVYISEKIPDLKVYAFEPVPAIFEALQANLKNIPSAKAYNVGLSDEEKTVEFNYYPRVNTDSTSTPFDFDKQVDMFMTKYSTGIARLAPKKVKRWIITKILKYAYAPVKVNCTMKTVSQVIAENQIDRIDLLKMDAENADREVIAGIKEEDWKKIRQIVMEIHTNIPGGETAVSDFTNLLKSKGFTFELDTDSRWSFVGSHMLWAKR